jgi:hypothetical protein
MGLKQAQQSQQHDTHLKVNVRLVLHQAATSTYTKHGNVESEKGSMHAHRAEGIQTVVLRCPVLPLGGPLPSICCLFARLRGSSPPETIRQSSYQAVSCDKGCSRSRKLSEVPTHTEGHSEVPESQRQLSLAGCCSTRKCFEQRYFLQCVEQQHIDHNDQAWFHSGQWIMNQQSYIRTRSTTKGTIPGQLVTWFSCFVLLLL